MGKPEVSENGGKRRRLEKNSIVNVDDRLSSLPDSLLISILSLLPIYTAAATSALSRRWRHLWTQVSSLWLLDLELDTLKHILAQLTSPKIQLLQLYPLDDNDEKTVSATIDVYFNHVRCRNVEQIEVNLEIFLSSFCMPHWVFMSQSLVSLILDGLFIQADNDDDDEDKLPDCVCLPNLKNLGVYLNDCNRNLVRKLVRSGPRLEVLNLTIWFSKGEHLVDISLSRN